MLDAREVDAEAPRIIDPKVGIRTDIKEHGVPLLTPAARDHYRETVAGAAQLVEHGLAVVPLILSARRSPSGQVDDLRNLRHSLIDARQGVGLVVDDDEDLQCVQLN